MMSASESILPHASSEVIQINQISIHANSPEEVYKKAPRRGKHEEQTYENLQGKRVVTTFKV